MNSNYRYLRTMLFSIAWTVGHLVLAGCNGIGCKSDVECDDGKFCTGIEICSYNPFSPFQVFTGSQYFCDVECCGSPCAGSTPICDESQNRCLPCQNDSQCNDQIGCTDDSCKRAAGECENVDNCPDDGIFCNGREYCDKGIHLVGCGHAGETFEPLCYNPTPICDEAEKRCLPCQSDDQCHDDNGCTVDSCTPTTGECIYQFCPDDGDPCTDEFCGGDGETCEHQRIACQRSEDCPVGLGCTCSNNLCAPR